MIPDFLKFKLEQQYSESITNDILDGFMKKRKVTLRVNTLKSNASLVKAQLLSFGINFDVVAWSDEALIILNSDEKAIRELDLYKNGEIYLQSLSSMLPPIILAPKENTDILDMAAAPGGKTTRPLCFN